MAKAAIFSLSPPYEDIISRYFEASPRSSRTTFNQEDEPVWDLVHNFDARYMPMPLFSSRGRQDLDKADVTDEDKRLHVTTSECSTDRLSPPISPRSPTFTTKSYAAYKKIDLADSPPGTVQSLPILTAPQYTPWMPSLTKRVLLALPAALSFAAWATLLIHFQAHYLNLKPNPDGSWPRIGFTYAAYPFISSIGAIRSTEYRACCITVACCVIWVFAWDFSIGMQARDFVSFQGRRGWWFVFCRRSKLFAAVAGSAFLIALPYANVDDGSAHNRHVIFMILQMVGMASARFWDFFASREMMKRITSTGEPIPQTMIRSSLWKTVEGAVCGICALIVLPAISACSSAVTIISVDPKVVRMSGSCWGLLSYGAVLEWVMSTAWLFYMLSFGWDLVHLWEWNALLRVVPGSCEKKQDDLQMSHRDDYARA